MLRDSFSNDVIDSSLSKWMRNIGREFRKRVESIRSRYLNDKSSECIEDGYLLNSAIVGC